MMDYQGLGDRVRYPFVIFDWGDTLMKDDPQAKTPMVQWPVVEAVDGAEEVLSVIHAQRTVILATNAVQSDEADIRRALQRVNLDDYVDHIFCFRNTGLRKPSADFFQHISHSLKAPASDMVMVGDSFETDIQGANLAGVMGVWLNRHDTEVRVGEQHTTIHHLRELPHFLAQVA